MDEFETVYDDEGFSYKRKRIPDDADQRARTKIMAYNRLVKKRARDAHNSQACRRTRPKSRRPHRSGV